MFRIDSEKTLLAAFRPRDRKLVEGSPELALPAIVRDYVAWTHPAGGRVFLVFAVPGGAPTGIVFDSNGGSGTPAPQMCDWCHCPGTGTTVALLNARLNSKKSVGVHLCCDLSCKRKLEDEANRGGHSVAAATARLVERMGRFAREGLQMDLTGARR